MVIVNSDFLKNKTVNRKQLETPAPKYLKSVHRISLTLLLLLIGIGVFSQTIDLPYYNYWNAINYKNTAWNDQELNIDMDFNYSPDITSIICINSFNKYLRENNIRDIQTVHINNDSSDTLYVSNTSFNYIDDIIENNIYDYDTEENTYERLSYENGLIKEIIHKEANNDSIFFRYICSYEYYNDNRIKLIELMTYRDCDSANTIYSYKYDENNRLTTIEKSHKGKLTTIDNDSIRIVDTLMTDIYNFTYKINSIEISKDGNLIKEYLINSENKISCIYSYDYNDSNIRVCNHKEYYYDNIVIVSLPYVDSNVVEYYYSYKNGMINMVTGAASLDMPAYNPLVFLVSRSFIYNDNLVSEILFLSLIDEGVRSDQVKYSYSFSSNK